MRITFILFLLHCAAATAAPTCFIAKGAEWKYLDNGSDQGSAWQMPDFDDSTWRTGAAKLGYADGAVTTLDFGEDAKHKFITTYFRKSFTVTNPDSVPRMQLELLRDDGAIVYLNGVEVTRSNMPAGKVKHTTKASKVVSGAAESRFNPYLLDPAMLRAGNNIIAVEVHQDNGGSSDLGFDLALTSGPEPTATNNTSALPELTRGPYLQQAGPTTLTLRWRTDTPALGWVKTGATLATLTQTTTAALPSTEHVVTLTGLTPDTRYYYHIGVNATTLAGGDETFTFTTPPVAGTAKHTRIWVLGDAGTDTASQRKVRDAFYTHTGSRIPDLCLLLGDNAYDRGTDAEYQTAIFKTYPTMLRRIPFWSCIGNHETAQSVSFVDSYPYFRIFTFPAKGECGGLPSGTEHYYSFDYGNIHFIALDSMTADRSPKGAMATWLTEDLAATSATWIIAFFHHPPYTKGSHDSDSEGPLIDMRSNFLPILEQGGVDLVLSGHSHSYERSFLIDGHYGMSNTFTAAMKKDPGDGQPKGTGAYLKPLTGPKAHLGAVYNVTGSAGQISGGRLNHPAMHHSANELGSVMLDIQGNRLESTFVRDDGTLRDTYTILKQDGKS